MILINIITGLLLVGAGFLIKKYPEMIAGYNTLEKNQKEKFDIKGYSSLIKRAFIVAGLLIILSSIISKFIHWSTGFFLSILIPIIVVVVFLNLKTQKYKYQVK